jgi:hypothetical protein
MYYGRFQLGQSVPLAIRTDDANGTPTTPDDVPSARIYKDDGTLVKVQRIPTLDKSGVTGLFLLPLFLSSTFAVGGYRVVYSYTISGSPQVKDDYFEIGAGGNAGGAVIGMFWYDRPQAKFLIQQLDSGKLVQGRNPRL